MKINGHIVSFFFTDVLGSYTNLPCTKGVFLSVIESKIKGVINIRFLGFKVMKEMKNPKIDFSGFYKFKFLDFNKEMFLDSRIQIWITPSPSPLKKMYTKSLHFTSKSIEVQVFTARWSLRPFNEKFNPTLFLLYLHDIVNHVINMFFCKHFVHAACFELNLLDFFLFFVSFTGNYFDNFICDRVYYTTVGSGLSQCLCRNKGKATFCCSNLFNHRYAGGMNFFLY